MMEWPLSSFSMKSMWNWRVPMRRNKEHGIDIAAAHTGQRGHGVMLLLHIFWLPVMISLQPLQYSSLHLNNWPPEAPVFISLSPATRYSRYALPFYSHPKKTGLSISVVRYTIATIISEFIVCFRIEKFILGFTDTYLDCVRTYIHTLLGVGNFLWAKKSDKFVPIWNFIRRLKTKSVLRGRQKFSYFLQPIPE